MAYSEELAGRIRVELIAREGYVEKKMFGGICFMLKGNMACGIVGDFLIARVGPVKYAEALDEPHAALFDFTGRPMTGWVKVAPEGWNAETDLKKWVQMGVDYALSLPPK
ncbi:MAG: RNA methyltransferase [Desulfuromonas sp.]|uniref:TfoX/Sxy family protein n=1 Tax=Desulfuromonas sp. TaxID=892 RepID=UPI000CB00F03|nr:TfoX/Sxy family protein [Desulfuromonas sp.]PLX85177.1 MAG: RNA methyltransferase [Desulfuromonas sp.]